VRIMEPFSWKLEKELSLFSSSVVVVVVVVIVFVVKITQYEVPM
jgi:hypothetical protein